MLVTLVERVGAQTLVEDVQRLEVDRVVEVARRRASAAAEELLDPLDAVVGERHAAALLVDDVVLLFAKRGMTR